MPQPTSPDRAGARLAIIGASTLIGKEVQQVLADRRVVTRTVELYEETERESHLFEDDGEALLLQPFRADLLQGVDVAFFCGRRGAAAGQIRAARAQGVTVIDLTQSLSPDEAPLIVADINHDRITSALTAYGIPAPAAVAGVLLLAPLHKAIGLRRALMTIHVPASDEGKEGIDELYKQTLSLLNFQRLPNKVFSSQIAFNLTAAGGGDAGASARRAAQVASQMTQVLNGSRLDLRVHLVQAPIFYCHAISCFVETERPVDRSEIAGVFSGYPFVAYHESTSEYPSPVAVAGSDEIHVAIEGPNQGSAFWCWAVSDNIRRGAAVTAVLLAERLLNASA